MTTAGGAGDSCSWCKGTGNSAYRDASDSGLHVTCWDCQGRGRSLEAQIDLAFQTLDQDPGECCAAGSCRYCFGAGYRAALRWSPTPAALARTEEP